MRFTDKVVLVVGGNSGIGLASAQAFAAEGGIVHLTGRDQATIDSAVASIPGATGYRADVADLASLDPVIAAIKARHGRLAQRVSIAPKSLKPGGALVAAASAAGGPKSRLTPGRPATSDHKHAGRRPRAMRWAPRGAIRCARGVCQSCVGPLLTAGGTGWRAGAVLRERAPTRLRDQDAQVRAAVTCARQVHAASQQRCARRQAAVRAPRAGLPVARATGAGMRGSRGCMSFSF